MAEPILSDEDALFFASMPEGVRFSPTDAELIHYLTTKVQNKELPRHRIAETNIYLFHPRNLCRKWPLHREEEWYFFTTRKYHEGRTRPDRSVLNIGYWRAWGPDTQVKVDGLTVGYRLGLDFHEGDTANSRKTEYKMHEYRLHRKPAPQTLEECVLCKLYIHRQDKSKDKQDDEEKDDKDNLMVQLGDVSVHQCPDVDEEILHLVVDKAINDDNDDSTVSLHPETMERFQFLCGGKILIAFAKEGTDTVCVALSDDTNSDEPIDLNITPQESKIRMNKVVRNNLKVQLGDLVFVHKCPEVGKEVFLDEVGRLEVLRTQTRNLKVAEDVNLEGIARETNGYSRAALEALCDEALLQCTKKIDLIDNVEDELVDAEILPVVTNKHFQTALKAKSLADPRETVVDVPNVHPVENERAVS